MFYKKNLIIVGPTASSPRLQTPTLQPTPVPPAGQSTNYSGRWVR